MHPLNMLRRLSWPLILVLSLAAVVSFSEPPRPVVTSQGHLPPLLPRVELVRTLGAPVLHLVTDYYWIQMIQVVGRASRVEEYRDIFDYAWFITELDPRFRAVYPFAGAVLPVSLGRGKFANAEESRRILEKGLTQYPDHIYMRILLSYNLTVYQRDFEAAAKLLQETAALPGAPSHVLPLATRLYAQAKDFDKGLTLAQSLAESAEDPETRELFARRVQELKLERVLEQVDAAVEAWRQREGRLPPDVRALVATGDLPALPVDPFGGEIVLDEEGRSRSTAERKRLTDTLRMDLEVTP
jgi:hypothetical protein